MEDQSMEVVSREDKIAEDEFMVVSMEVMCREDKSIEF